MEEKHWPTLYKRSSTGKIQQWRIGTAADYPDKKATILVIHGQLGGKMQAATTEIKSGKNVGKTNATTPWTQACSEAESLWKKQLDKGYTEDPNGKDLSTKPMLAHDYNKYKQQVAFPCFVQPKLDGIRCLAHADKKGIKLISRMGKELTVTSHISDALKGVMKAGEVWDGELYVHGVPFQSIASWVKRDQPDTKRLTYHVYDCISDEPFINRYLPIVKRIGQNDDWRLVPVGVYRAKSHEDLVYNHNQFVASGYEGLMVRHNGCAYKAGYRSRELLKMKAFKDDEFEIVGVREGKGKFAGLGIFTCRTESGTLFDCTPRGTEEARREYWENADKYIGKLLTVRYFEMTDGGSPVPRFPVGIVVRDYE